MTMTSLVSISTSLRSIFARRSLIAFTLTSLAALSSVGCVGGNDAAELDDDAIGSTNQSFEEFKAHVYREPGTGIYIVNGDTPIENDEQLEAFFVEHVQNDALIVNRVGAVDDRWDDTQKLSLTYCVSTAFGANYCAVVQASASA